MIADTGTIQRQDGDSRSWETVREVDLARFSHFIPNYLIPLLDRRWTICSVGCGTGLDVEMLRGQGFSAFGIDPGCFASFHSERASEVQSYLKTGSAEDLPFGDQRFDFVYALEVIEHVGCEGFGWKMNANTPAVRLRFLESCLEMVAEGGSLLLTSSNRLCPVDPGHGHAYSAISRWVRARTGIRLAPPWHKSNFLWSLGDVRRMAGHTRFAGRLIVEPISIANYPKICSSNIPVAAWIRAYLRIVSSRFLLASPFCPILVVEITKL